MIFNKKKTVYYLWLPSNCVYQELLNQLNDIKNNLYFKELDLIFADKQIGETKLTKNQKKQKKEEIENNKQSEFYNNLYPWEYLKYNHFLMIQCRTNVLEMEKQNLKNLRELVSIALDMTKPRNKENLNKMGRKRKRAIDLFQQYTEHRLWRRVFAR